MMEFHKIAEILGADYLLAFDGVLLGIITIETTFLCYLIHCAGGLKKLFWLVSDEYKNRTKDTGKKRDDANPRVDSKKDIE